MPKDVAVISDHEKGFFQGDLYLGASDWDWHDWDGASPDSFFTTTKTCSLEDAKKSAIKFWPNAEVRIVLTCENCGGVGSEHSPNKGEGMIECSDCDGDGVIRQT